MSQDNQSTAPDQSAGGYGTPTAEQEMGGQQDAGFDSNEPETEPGQPPVPREADGVGFQDGEAVVPSVEAEIDESNSNEQGADDSSSEPGQEAAGLPDGSGNDLPQEKSPKDDDGESFDAG